MTEKYLAQAQELGLFITGGSDYHGVPGERELGDGQINEQKAYLPFFWQ
ncbi:MAG TPA: phosphatase, partial [Firmicutes bacterium]|nr:phosphatase [Bacillota bacterium]